MKNLILIIITFLSIMSVNAQIGIGVNSSIGSGNIILFSSFDISHPKKYKNTISYNFGINTNYVISTKIHLNVELNFIKKGHINIINDSVYYPDGLKFIETNYDNNFYIENPIYANFLLTKYVGINLGFVNNILLYNSFYNGYNKLVSFKIENTATKRYNLGLLLGFSFNPIKKLDISLNLKSDLMPYYKDRNTNSLTQGYNYGLMLSVSYNLFSF